MKFLAILLGILIFLTGCNSLEKNLVKLKSPSSVDRCEAILWLYNNVKTETTQKLVMDALYRDSSPGVRSLAVRLLGIENSEEYLTPLETSLNDPSALVRMEVVQSLGSMHAKQSVPKLLKMLEVETDKTVRLKILKTLQYIRAKESVPVLIERLEDEEPAVRLQALLLLKYFTKQSLGIDKEPWQKWYESQVKTD